jgi:hypothetical protein
MTDSDEDSDDSDEEETESFVNKKVKEGHLFNSVVCPHSRLTLACSLTLCFAQSLNWEPTFFTANITFFGKKDGFNLFISKLADEKRKLDANAIKWLLKPIVKLLEYLPLRLVRKIVEQLRHVVFSRLLEMSDEGAFMTLLSIVATINHLNLFCHFSQFLGLVHVADLKGVNRKVLGDISASMESLLR